MDGDLQRRMVSTNLHTILLGERLIYNNILDYDLRSSVVPVVFDSGDHHGLGYLVRSV